MLLLLLLMIMKMKRAARQENAQKQEPWEWALSGILFFLENSTEHRRNGLSKVIDPSWTITLLFVKHSQWCH